MSNIIPNELASGIEHLYHKFGNRFFIGILIFGAIVGVTCFVFRAHIGLVLGVAAGILGFVAFAGRVWQLVGESETVSLRLQTAEDVARKEPERAKPAWDVARITLEAYFQKNLRQIDAIFFT